MNNWWYKWITDDEVLELYKEFRSPIKISWYTKEDIEWGDKVRVTFSWEIFWEVWLVLEWETVFTVLKDYI